MILVSPLSASLGLLLLVSSSPVPGIASPLASDRIHQHRAIANTHNKSSPRRLDSGDYQSPQLASRSDNGNQTTALTRRGDYTGTATFYNAETGNMGACGWYIKNGDWSVAIKADLYGNLGLKSWWCGQKITITGNGKTAKNVVIADACPGCQGWGGLDFTPDLFSYFISQDAGVMPISWHLSSEDGGNNNGGNHHDDNKGDNKDDNDNDWKPSPSSSSKWVEPSPSSKKWTEPSSKKVEEWKPSSSSWNSASSSKKKVEEWTPSSTSKNTWTPSSSASSSSSYNASSTASVLSQNNTLHGAQRNTNSNSTVSLPGNSSSPNSATDGSKGSGQAIPAKRLPGNLGRTAQIILDLGGLAYAAASK